MYLSWIIASRFAAVYSICLRKLTFTLLRVTSAFHHFVQSAYAKSAWSSLKLQTSKHFCHTELVSASYQYSVFTTFWIDLEINSGLQECVYYHLPLNYIDYIFPVLREEGKCILESVFTTLRQVFNSIKCNSRFNKKLDFERFFL